MGRTRRTVPARKILETVLIRGYGPLTRMSQPPANEFEKAAAQARGGFLSDLWGFLKTNKKWWLLPIFVVFLILGLLILLSSTGVAPFIYTLF